MMVVWIVIALLLVSALFSARLTVKPGRAHIWSTPKELDLPYEDVRFEAQDGVRLVGWFIPAPAHVRRPAPTILNLHGWPWCRMGTQAKNPLNDLPGSKPVPLLPYFKRLHDEGYNILAPDLRNFGDSESAGVVTGGWLESRDVIGALDYLEKRSDVDMNRIGAVGWSQGGATLMFAVPQTDRIKAAIAIQPTTPTVFGKNYSRSLMGPLAAIIRPLSEVFYRLAGGPSLSFIQPRLAAAGVRAPMLYVQGTGDRWGSQEDVAAMAAATPGSSVIYPETNHRFDGYTWMIDHPEVTVDFFRKHLGGAGAAAEQASGAADRDTLRTA